jgi:polar amino acid transport system substrate-binding protein
MDEVGGWLPFLTAAKPRNPGIMAEITEALQRYSNLEFIPVKLPQKRAKVALREGSVDFDFICLEWLVNGVVSSEYVTSEPLYELTESFITLKKNGSSFPTRNSFAQKRVGTIAGYYYFDDHTFTRTDFLNENQLMSGLKHERFEVIILEQETAKHWAEINDVNIHFAALHSKGYFLMRFRKKHQSLG